MGLQEQNDEVSDSVYSLEKQANMMYFFEFNFQRLKLLHVFCNLIIFLDYILGDQQGIKIRGIS